MKLHIKITQHLLSDIRTDLRRRHAHAWERVGFLRAGLSAGQGETLILAAEYRPVADEDYERCPTVGAKINSAAIRKALEWADGWPGGLLHVHAHAGSGVPYFSPDDDDGNSRLVPSFFNVAPTAVHGALLLSDDHLTAQMWVAKLAAPRSIDKVTVIRAPLWRWLR